MIEVVIFLPLLFLLLMGMEQFAKLTYTYYAIKKMEYTVGRYVSSQQGVNFCAGNADPNILAAENLALTGTTDNSAPSFLPLLTTDMFVVTPERVDSTGAISACTCDVTGCDESVGGGSPTFISVSIPTGYPITPAIPFMTAQTIPLIPEVKVPYGGT
jgi:hypothetical protein